MTTATKSSECYYANRHCRGETWQCRTCGESYCSEGHSHNTELGQNVECVACERSRKDAKLLAGPDQIEKKLARADVGGRLDDARITFDN